MGIYWGEETTEIDFINSLGVTGAEDEKCSRPVIDWVFKAFP